MQSSAAGKTESWPFRTVVVAAYQTTRTRLGLVDHDVLVDVDERDVVAGQPVPVAQQRQRVRQRLRTELAAV